MGSGWYGIKRLIFDPRRESDVSRVEEQALDKRQICVAAGNGMYDQPFESRCTVKLMGRNEASKSDSHPDRRELTLTAGRDSIGREATSTFMRYCMTLSNIMWIPYVTGCLRRFDTTMVEIFYALTVKILVPAGYPDMQCRPLAMMKRQAKSYAVMRLSSQWERCSGLTPEQRNAGRAMFFMANAVVQAQDVLQAYFDITGLTDTRKEEAEILSALKARILVDTVQFDFTPRESPTFPGHYITSVRGSEGLADACPTLGESIIQSVLPKLQFSTSATAATVAIERDKDHRNSLTISKAAFDNPGCLTQVQQIIVEYLVSVILSVTPGHRMWYPEVRANGDETGNVVFRAAVLQHILGGALVRASNVGNWRLFKKVAQDERALAMQMFAKSELMSYRPDGGTGDLSASVANPLSSAALQGVSRQAKPLGLLDELTALEGCNSYQEHFEHQNMDDPGSLELPDASAVEAWLAELPALHASKSKRVPVSRPAVSTLDLHGVLVVKASLAPIIHAIQTAKCTRCNVKPPLTANQHEVMDRALQHLINVLFSISGEAEPGSDIYCGASLTAAEGITWKRIGAFDGTITVKNPRRRDIQNKSLLEGIDGLSDDEDLDDDTSSGVLPPTQATVTFSAGECITDRLLVECRAINVPFADPSDDQIPAIGEMPADEFSELPPERSQQAQTGGAPAYRRVSHISEPFDDYDDEYDEHDIFDD